jgi:hypothetical protein
MPEERLFLLSMTFEHRSLAILLTDGRRKKHDSWFLYHGREIYRICLLQLR